MPNQPDPRAIARGVAVAARPVLGLAIAIGIPMVGGGIASLVSAKGILGWYKKLKKPKWTPPNFVFGPAWSVFYTAMGVASWLVWKNAEPGRRLLPLAAYGGHVALNWLWNPLFFAAHRPDLAFYDASAMLATAAGATVLMAGAAQPQGGTVVALMGPYMAWVAFATALSYRIWKDNPHADKIKDDSWGDIGRGVASSPASALVGENPAEGQSYYSALVAEGEEAAHKEAAKKKL